MKRSERWFVLFLSLLLAGSLQAQFIVHDPITLAQMIKKFTMELTQWQREVQHWGKQEQAWAKELQHFTDMKTQWEKENTLLKKLTDCAEATANIWVLMMGGVKDNFNWQDLRLKEINDILAAQGLANPAANDPYQGLFTQGKKIEEIFTQIRVWDSVTKSEKYQKNADYRQYVDQLISDQKKLLDDLQNKISVIAKLNNLVAEREKKYTEIQKRLEAAAKETPVNFPSLWVLDSEVSLELCRQMFHLVTLDRIDTENLLLDELRFLNEMKREEKFTETSLEKDKQAVVQAITGGKGEVK